MKRILKKLAGSLVRLLPPHFLAEEAVKSIDSKQQRRLLLEELLLRHAPFDTLEERLKQVSHLLFGTSEQFLVDQERVKKDIHAVSTYTRTNIHLDAIYRRSRHLLASDPSWRGGCPYTLSTARQAYEKLSKHSPVLNKCYLDLGCGRANPYGVSLVMFANGASNCVALDLNSFPEEQAAQALYNQVLDMLAHPKRWALGNTREEEVLERIQKIDGDALSLGKMHKSLANIPLEHQVGDIGTIDLKAASVNWMSSRAVLEHFLDFESAVTRLKEITAPGGVAWHLVDLIDHRNYNEPQKFHQRSMLEEPDDWTDGLINCLRAGEIVQHFERVGFEILSKCAPIEKPYPPERLKFLNPRYREMPEEDINTLHLDLVIKRSL